MYHDYYLTRDNRQAKGWKPVLHAGSYKPLSLILTEPLSRVGNACGIEVINTLSEKVYTVKAN